MDSVPSARDRRRTIGTIRQSLRECGAQLAILNRQVSERLSLRDNDLSCLDLISRHGPLSPSALARAAGLHPATLTGILDRLEKGGWLVRERDPADRRAVLLRAQSDRGAQVFALYAGMNRSIEEICGSYSDAELIAISDFLARTARAGQQAAESLSDG